MNDFWKRAAAVLFILALLAPALMACKRTCAGFGTDCTVAPPAPAPLKTQKEAPVGTPKPKPADPEPPATSGSSNVRYPIVLECTWKGMRWMKITPWIGGQPGATLERSYKEERDPAAAGGTWSELYSVPPATNVAVQCDPMEAPKGLNQCRIKNFGAVVDHRQVAQGGVRCSWRTPG